MTHCPLCRAKNIPGADWCEECGQPLDDTHLPPLATEVERSLVLDRVRVLEPKVPITVSTSTSVGEALRLMVDRRIGCVIVVEGSQVVGIFSERDALRKLNVHVAELFGEPIGRLMTERPETLVADAKVAFAVQRMDLGGYRHLPIVGPEGKLVGVISARDILRYLTSHLEHAS